MSITTPINPDRPSVPSPDARELVTLLALASSWGTPRDLDVTVVEPDLLDDPGRYALQVRHPTHPTRYLLVSTLDGDGLAWSWAVDVSGGLICAEYDAVPAFVPTSVLVQQTAGETGADAALDVTRELVFAVMAWAAVDPTARRPA